MPLYDFEDTETGEQFTELLSLSNRVKFLELNPQLKQIITRAPSLVSGTNMEAKMDDGWKENLSRIVEANPNSALADKIGGRSIKQAKLNDAADKAGLRKTGQYKFPGWDE
tara:strand:+ start:1422 stop:1754 length:333 start_codon:yes stop_codon:yes gene_type:complete